MQFKIYKSGQGYHTRLWTAIVLFVIVSSGCFLVYKQLGAYVADSPSGLWIQTLVPAGVCILLTLGIFWIVNRPKVADFMIAAEGEVKKVSWSSRKEIAVSTCIVIIVVAVMGVLLALTDTLLAWCMQMLGIY